ncbi:MAG TPA: response regulator [Glycomyces sp.]|nr:response regulator [Glycomyces sp.]
MSEAIWIELIKVLPTFLWIGFGFIALAIAKRLFTSQAPRMTRVETPWVTVELAQQAIEQATARGAAAESHGPPVAPDWAALFPLPAQHVPANGAAAPVSMGDPVSANAAPQSPPVAESEGADPVVATEQRIGTAPADRVPNTPPAGEPTDHEPSDNHDDEAPATMTEPNAQIPPRTYPRIAGPHGGGYYAPPVPGDQTDYPAPAPFPPYSQPPSYRPRPDSQASLRAATRLALSADLLHGGSILWVDDYPENNESLAQLFRSVGIRVETVLSTDGAVRALKSRSYDLVISDLGRGNESAGENAGLVLLDHIAEVGLSTPVILFTGAKRALRISHPRAAAVTGYAEDLVNYVVDFVAYRKPALGDQSWLSRLRG